MDPAENILSCGNLSRNTASVESRAKIINFECCSAGSLERRSASTRASFGSLSLTSIRKDRAGNFSKTSSIDGVSIADVESFQFFHGVCACQAVTVGFALQCPVVKHCKSAVRRSVDIEFDDIGAAIECRLHRTDGVLQVVMSRRQQVNRQAGIALHRYVKPLIKSAMSQQSRHSRSSRRESGVVVQVEKR